ncbi:MAG: hypothetical protein K0S98_2229 [Propionibacteriaceae bacterium]|nr:hypothetical protein [Propionibacteriaceae bacterium]
MRATTNSPARGDIVVGVDTSPSGRGALTWAARYARVTDQRLRALHVFSYRAAGRVVWTPGGLPGTAAGGSDELKDDIESQIKSAFDALNPEPNWRLEFWGGSIGLTLVEQARQADLLVIGTREHTGVDRVLSGSVSHYCLSRAHCPIVAVPPTPVLSGHSGAGSLETTPSR